MNRLNPIKELYDMYLEEKDTPRIVELKDNDLDFVSDVEGPANPYIDFKPRISMLCQISNGMIRWHQWTSYRVPT